MPTARLHVLVVDTSTAVTDALSERDDIVTTHVSTLAEAAAVSADVDCLVCTDRLPETTVGDAVERLRDRYPNRPLVVVPADGSERLATDLLARGAEDYVPAGRPDRLVAGVRAAVADGDTSVETAVTDDATPVPLASVAGSLSEVLLTIDEDSTIQYVNDAVEDVFGYPPETVQGESLTKLMPDRFEAPHHEGVATYLQTGERTLDWSSIELPGQHAEGHEIDLEISFGEFVLDGERHFTGLVRDVSSIAEREATLSRLYEASQQLLLATTPEEIAETVVETAAEALDLPVTGVFRHDPDRAALVPVALSEASGDLFEDPVLEAGESLAWETFQHGETRLVEGVEDRDQVHNPETPIRTEIQIPIGDRWILLSGATEQREFEDFRIDFAELLATTATAALQRVDREAELQRYETLFRTIDERVCVVDGEGRFRIVNEALCDFLGTTESDLLGTQAAEYLVDTAVEQLSARLESLCYGESTTVETELLADGRRVPCEIDVTTLPPEARMAGYVVAVHDISDRKRVESELEAERDRFAELFGNVPDPVVEAHIVDGTPVVRSVNDAFVSTFGYDRAQVVGESLNDFVIPPAGDEAAAAMDRRAGQGELVEAEVRRETTHGIRDFLFRGIPVSSDGEGTLAFGIYTDITDQRLRQRRLSVLNRVLRHNIRNDMSVVLGRANYLDEREASNPAEHVDVIKRMARDVVDLAEGIRTAERALDREDAPERPLSTLLVDAVEPYRGRPDADVRTAIPDESMPELDERLSIAVEQLVENAVEHGDGDPTTVVVGADVGPDTVTIHVADDGPGLPDAERAALQSDRESQLEHGLGVGLWLVSWLVTTLGGSVDFAENDPRGTVVTLTFPASAVTWPDGQKP